ncbi:glycerol-3-phosphate acyltransferase 3 [Musca vetustissima]|uniref:glycerol-3-phosphate acyltransferase 3 n=1 Tax=Musca vetustissima TaxID=27455 RepID=UPI002AB65824|nr:glycerol-3-phosphate acyltransferase 3 [Musca vetustissima]
MFDFPGNIPSIIDIFWITTSVFILFLILLSAINKSIGVRRSYVKLLLRIFEYGRVSIEIAHKERHATITEANAAHTIANPTKENDKLCPVDATNEISNDANNTNGNTLINRDNVLLPTPNEPNFNKEKLTETIKDEKISFHFEECLDYIKAGVEAIIEDEVTSRFEAEQLKSWNLLTRTNRQYEFINWKITLIWVLGFAVRYTILMPLRVLVCFIGVVFAVCSNSLVALIPIKMIRHFCADIAFKVTFRIICLSLSAVINFYNVQYKPKSVGFCVANHTSPLDVAILSTDCTFSLVVWLTICTAIVGYMPEGDRKRQLVNRILRHCFSVLSSAISAVINYHNEENRPTTGICVANHTSPIDVLVLMCDTTYSLIGQRHGGFLGILQRALARASPHIWFERGEAKDRHAVAERLKQHVSDPSNPPILIFPEGTCINNTSVMQFKKGSFEVGGVIYPVAIKYDPRFGDAFWNSSKYSMLQYLYMMMTSWAIVCDVWYLPPMYRQQGESAIDFANRVKSVIAKQGGLVDLVWDGQLKRMKPKKEWKEMQQVEFIKRLKGD